MGVGTWGVMGQGGVNRDKADISMLQGVCKLLSL